METKIWEVVKGCTEIAPGCDSCPSAALARAKGESFNVKYQRYQLEKPAKLLDPTILLVAHGSDLFIDSVPDDFIFDVFKVIEENPQHKFEIVTKRVERALYLADRLPWPDHLYFGVGVATKNCTWRVNILKQIPAKFKYVSICPILEDLGPINFSGIDLVAVVEESWGANRLGEDQSNRKVKPKSIEKIKKQCKKHNVLLSLQEGVMYSEDLCLV